MSVTRKEQELYVLTIAERLQYAVEPFLGAADIARNQKMFFLQATSHPDCVRIANSILGFKRNYLWNWLTKEFVFNVFGPLSSKDQTAIALLIEKEVNQTSREVVLSKEIFQKVRDAFPTENPLVLKATFDRIFYSPRVKDLLKAQHKALSDRAITIRKIKQQISAQNANVQHSVQEINTAPPKDRIVQAYATAQENILRSTPKTPQRPQRTLDLAALRNQALMTEKNKELLGFLF